MREKDSLSFTSASRRADRRACHRHSCARRPPPSSTSSRRGGSPFPKTHKHARRTLTDARLVSSRPILSSVLCFCKLIMLKYVEPSWTILSGRDEIKWSFGPFILQSRDHAQWSSANLGLQTKNIAYRAVVEKALCQRLQHLSRDSPSIGRARGCSLARSRDGHGGRDDAVDARVRARCRVAALQVARLHDFRWFRFRFSRRSRTQRTSRVVHGWRKIETRRRDIVSRANVTTRALEPAHTGTNVHTPPSLVGFPDRRSPVRCELRH